MPGKQRVTDRGAISRLAVEHDRLVFVYFFEILLEVTNKNVFRSFDVTRLIFCDASKVNDLLCGLFSGYFGSLQAKCSAIETSAERRLPACQSIPQLFPAGQAFRYRPQK